MAFADDLAFEYEDTNIDNIQDNINHDLMVLSEWFYKHCMIMSDKTKVLQFKRAFNSSNNFKINYHVFDCFISNNCCSNKCFTVEKVSTFKYLGIILDCGLNWKSHCASIKQYIYMAVCKFVLLRTLVPADVLNKVYFALIQSKLSYGLFGVLKPIIVGQNTIIKIMCFKKNVFHLGRFT